MGTHERNEQVEHSGRRGVFSALRLKPPPDSNVGSGILVNAARSSSTNRPTFLRTIVTNSRLPWFVGFVVLLVLVLLNLRVVAAQGNLAWRKKVRMGHVLLGNPANVVNGIIEWGSYAVHSRNGPITFDIDLEESAKIGIVRVYGRGDSFHTDSPKPIVIQYSLDGQTYVNAGNCGLVLTQVAPCKVDVGGVSARYVRLSHPTHLVLTEIEVFPAQ